MDILEGRVAVLAALRAGRRRVEAVLVRQGTKDESIADLLEAAERLGVPVQRVREQALEARAHGKTHGGVLAVASPRPLDAAPPPGLDLGLLLDGVDDARNLGFALRSAEAFGVQAVFVRKQKWDFDGGDVSRASSGAFERLPVILGLPPAGLRLVGLAAGASKTLYEENLRLPAVLAVGGEKRGLSAAVRDRCASIVSIPTREGAPSLPLSHAAAVALSEAARQRGATP